jgi:hypothetical protein
LVASDDDEPLGGVLAGGVLAPEELLLLGALLGLELAPPEAEPELDFEGSVALGEVLEDELAPELDGGVDGGVALLLELPLVLPLLPVVLPVPLSWPHAARPKARATVAAMIESFMNPPWLGIRKSSKERARAQVPENRDLVPGPVELLTCCRGWWWSAWTRSPASRSRRPGYGLRCRWSPTSPSPWPTSRPRRRLSLPDRNLPALRRAPSKLQLPMP